jgi:PTS system nitrogen regulatory IIA component
MRAGADMVEDDPNEIMTVSQVATYLHLAEKTVVRMAQRAEIPAAKVASQWRFMRSIVREWLAAQMRALPVGRAGADGTGGGLLTLADLIRPELMVPDVRPGSKEDILRQLVVPLRQASFARESDKFLNGLVERERLMSTAVGNGLAIPHPRRPILGMFPEPAIALGICRAGVDFDAIDDRLVHVFLMVCATREEVHLQLMAKIAWLSRQDVMPKLRDVRDGAEAREMIAAAAHALEQRKDGGPLG